MNFGILAQTQLAPLQITPKLLYTFKRNASFAVNAVNGKVAVYAVPPDQVVADHHEIEIVDNAQSRKHVIASGWSIWIASLSGKTTVISVEGVEV